MIIDLGPDGGLRGGQVIATGTPEQVAATPGSATGEYLARVLRGEPLIPLSSITFAEEAGRGRPSSGDGPAVGVPIAPSRKRAAAAAR
jgi:excinuclease ABC subunit A